MKIKTRTVPVIAALVAVLLMGGCTNNGTAETTEALPAAVTDITSEAPAASESETQTESAESLSETAAAASSPADIVNEILSKVEMSSMSEVTEDRIGNYLEVDMASVESFSMQICGSGGFADEVGVFVMTDEASAKALKESVEKRIESRSIDFKDYNIDEYDKLQEAVVKISGNTLFFVVSGDNDAAEAVFDSMNG